MNRICRLIVLVVVIISLASAGAEKSPAMGISRDDVDQPSLDLKKITDRFYMIMGAGANITFFSGGEAALVVDSGNSPDLGARAIAMIRAGRDASKKPGPDGLKKTDVSAPDSSAEPRYH